MRKYLKINEKKFYCKLVKPMTARLQAPFTTKEENPYLKPLPPQVDINSSRGRFQQVNLGTPSAEERTRVEIVSEEPPLQTKKTGTVTKTTPTKTVVKE